MKISYLFKRVKKKNRLKKETGSRGVILPLTFSYGLKLSIVRIKRSLLNTRRRYVLVGSLLVLLAGSTIFLTKSIFTKAATFDWEQTSWVGGASTDLATHLSNQTNWDKYFSKEDNVIVGETIEMTPSLTAKLQTADTDFSGGNFSDTRILGLGNNSSVTLEGPGSSGVSVGYNHTCTVQSDGSAHCWGSGADGKLGNDSTTASSTPVQVKGGEQGGEYLANVDQVGAGYYHTCAATIGGEVYCWGEGTYGRLGNDSATESHLPVRVKGGEQGGEYLANITQISVGYDYTCALDANKNIYCWGHNNRGQLGIDSTVDSYVPVKVKGGEQTGEFLANIEQFDTGNEHVCALDIDKVIYCWGLNSYGRLGDNSTVDSYVPVKVKGGEQGGEFLTDMAQVSVGGQHTCAVTVGGIAYCWGYNNVGQLGNDSTTTSEVPVKVKGGQQGGEFLIGARQISVSGINTCSINADNALYCWGSNADGRLGDDSITDSYVPVKVKGGQQGGEFLVDVNQISATYHTCATTIDGAIYCWGYNNYGQLGNNSKNPSRVPVSVVDLLNPLSNLSQLSAGSSNSCAITTENNLHCWGYNTYGQLGNNSTVNSDIPVKVQGGQQGEIFLGDVRQVSTKGDHSCAVTTDNLAYCWGRNDLGQLGNGSTTESHLPIKVKSGEQGGEFLVNVKELKVGSYHTCAVTTDNAVYCWGYNGYGNLGDNSTTTSNIPVRVKGGEQGGEFLVDVNQIGMGNFHSCAIATDDSAYCWGYNKYGQLGNDSTATSNIPVQVKGGEQGEGSLVDVREIDAGNHFSCVSTTDNLAYCWGYNNYGQLGNDSTAESHLPVQVKGGEQGGVNLLDVEQLSVGITQACAATSDNLVYCWGYNNVGQLGNDSTAESHLPVQVKGGEQGGGFLANIEQIGAGGQHACSIINGGTAYCWGAYTLLGSADGVNQHTPVSVVKGDFSLTSTAYAASGDFTSATLDFAKMVNVGTLAFTTDTPTDTTVKFQVAANNDNSTWNFIGPDGTDSTYFIVSGTQLPESLNTKRYFKYKASLSTANDLTTSAVKDVTLSYYPTESIISSVYNSSDSANIASGFKITGNEEGGGLTNSTIYAQIRAGSDGDPIGANWTDWCGPNSCDGQDYFNFTNTTLNTFIPFELGSPMLTGVDAQYFQYKIMLGSKDGITAPTVTGTTVQYVVNNTPEVSLVTANQDSDGTVVVNYDVIDGDNATVTTYFLVDMGVALNEELSSSDATITVNDATELPASGVIQLDNEQLSYTGKVGNDLTGVTRGALNSRAATHSLGSVIWFKGTTVSGEAGVGVVPGSDKTGIWDIKTDLNNRYFATAKIKVTVNDGEAANQLHSADSAALIIDTADPAINSFVVDSRGDAPSVLSVAVSDNTMTDLKVRMSNQADLSVDGKNVNSGEWLDYFTEAAWNLSGSPEVIYYQFKDSYGNTSAGGVISSITVPVAPSNLVYQDISHTETAEWREFIAWEVASNPVLGFKQYNIYRATDGVNYTFLAAQTDREINYFVDANLDTSTTYYYKITAEDNNGNISNYSPIISDTPDGKGGSDLAPPEITNVDSAAITTQSAVISWDTDEIADSTVEYMTEEGGDFTDALSQTVATMADTESGLGQHRVVLTGLTPNTTYYFQVKSTDLTENSAINKEGTDGYSFTTLAGPAISNVSTSEINNTQAVVTWKTDIDSDSYVIYSVNSDLSNPLEIGESTLVKEHQVTLTGLVSGVNYYYYIKSGTATDNNGEEYYTFTTTVDSSAPTITFDSEDGVAEITATSAKISWDTSELATAILAYGTDTGYGEMELNSNYNTDHSFTLTGLVPGTQYYFSLNNSDQNGNSVNDDNSGNGYSFVTGALEDGNGPTISSVLVADLSYKTATVEWETDEQCSSTVSYGTTTDYGESYGNLDAITNEHSVVLPNLKPLTTYYYKVSSQDLAGNISTRSLDEENSALSFTTLSGSVDSNNDGQGDQLGDISDDVQNLIDNHEYTEQDIQNFLASGQSVSSDGPSVKISNNTTATISWSTNKQANGKVTYWQEGKDDNNSSTISGEEDITNKHKVVIKKLNAQTDYQYYVTSITPLGAVMVSEIKSFSTGDSPQISAIGISDITLDSAIVKWTTNSVSSTVVEYGTSAKYGKEKKSSSSGASTEHTVKLEDLVAGRTYYLRITGVDLDDETVTSDDYSFTTLELPKISNIQTKEITAEKATISWKTNVNTDSAVEYKIHTEEQGFSQGKLETVTEHKIVLEELIPGAKYQFKVSSKDQFGNKSESETHTFFTEDDNDPPVISAVKPEATVFPNKEDKIQTIVSWSTDKPASSIVAYKEGKVESSDGIAEKLKEEEVTEYNGWKLHRKPDSSLGHMFVFTDLKPSSVYYFKVASVDKRGNIAISENYSLLTPAKTQSVFDLIVNNFKDTFGWLLPIFSSGS